MDRRFGVSTRLFLDSRLDRAHLVQIAAHGFDAIELFASRSHFDYRDEDAIERLAEWLTETGLELHAVHAPVVESTSNGPGRGSLSNASGDESRRKAALAEIDATLKLAKRIRFPYLVVHLGVPANAQIPAAGNGQERLTSAGQGTGDNQPSAARRSLEDIVALASAVDVKVAIEILPNRLSTPTSLVKLIEDDLDGIDAGVCFDFGHAHLMGDLGEAIETLSGHIWTTHVHDNRGRQDDHLVPFGGTVNWDMAMMEIQKVGYDGALMFEISGAGDKNAVLERCAKARERLRQAFVVM
jgi:sugar phosphate isomerase/epimerase